MILAKETPVKGKHKLLLMFSQFKGVSKKGKFISWSGYFPELWAEGVFTVNFAVPVTPFLAVAVMLATSPPTASAETVANPLASIVTSA